MINTDQRLEQLRTEYRETDDSIKREIIVRQARALQFKKLEVKREKVTATVVSDGKITTGQKIILTTLIKKGRLPLISSSGLNNLSFDDAKKYITEAGY